MAWSRISSILRRATTRLGWTLVCVFTVAWLGSARYTCNILPTRTVDVIIWRGVFEFRGVTTVGHFEEGLAIHRDLIRKAPFEWWKFELERFGGRVSWVIFPLWVPIIPALALALGPWCVSKMACRWRRAPGACAKCGYDRAGLAPGAVCPECGQA